MTRRVSKRYSILLMFLLAPAALHATEACLVEALARIGFEGDHARRGRSLEFWKKYKTDARFAAWVIEKSKTRKLQTLDERRKGVLTKLIGADPRARAAKDAEQVLGWVDEFKKLDAAELERLRPKPGRVDFTRACSGSNCSDLYSLPLLAEPAEILEYERKVLQLKPGDTVKFSDGEFKLGEFLGAGNTTHVWAIEGRPDDALRIPFVTLGLKSRQADRLAIPLDEPFPLALVRAWITKLRDGTPDIPGVATVKVKRIGKLDDYAIVTRAKGTENGEKFMDRLDPVVLSSQSNSEMVTRIREELKVSPAEAMSLIRRREALIQATRKLKQAGFRDADYRQFVWEGDHWLALDW